MFYKKKKILYSGFTLIEALTLLFIFSLIAVTFYQVISVGTRYIQDSKNRLAALAIANEKMEIVRNLAYDDIGTIGQGNGNMAEEEDVVENGRQFHVETVVGYANDNFDGVYPADSIPNDYKKVIITISWGNAGLGGSEVKLESRFVPPGLEVLSPGDGILSINVFSDQPGGTGIPGSSVHIVNSETGLNTTQQTDSSGNVILVGPNIQNSIQKYEITVSKNGYETVATLPPYPATPYNPAFVHASVASGVVNMTNIVQNELGDLGIATVDYLGQSIGDIDFHLSGGKQIGMEVSDPLDLTPNEIFYNFEEESSTNSSGEKDFDGISPGQYEFSLGSSVTGYTLIGTDPAFPYKIVNGNMVYLFPLPSEPALDLKIKLAAENATSLLVSVLKNGDDSPIPEATVRLTSALGYDVSQVTEVDGRVFFPVTAEPLVSGAYNLEITADGFSGSDTEVTISEGALKVETIKLEASL